ncbi:Tuftelin-interacting protein 11 [Kappamyces sp. JEL0680]|nr:Tuftelin-interacting protein 11 [Kappamyces sp. JEL0680]
MDFESDSSLDSSKDSSQDLDRKINFIQKEAIKSQDSSGHDSDSQEDERPTLGGLGLGARPSGPAMGGKFNPLGTGFVPKPSLSVDKDFAAFEKSNKGIGSKLLMKMGYVPGQGLGKGGTGITAPIDVKLRPAGAGLGMIDERTDAVKKEKGVLVPEKKLSGKPGGPQHNRWKKAGIKKRKPLYKSAEQIVLETKASIPVVAAPISTKVRDMRGEEEIVFNDISEMSGLVSGASLDQLSPSTRLPELTHNVRLITDLAKNDLLHIARQIRIQEVSRGLVTVGNPRQEAGRVQRGTQESHRYQVGPPTLIARHSINRLEAVQELARDCMRIAHIHAKELAAPHGEHDIVESLFGPCLKPMMGEYRAEFLEYKLDHLVVGLLMQVLKARLSTWNPLDNPLYCANMIQTWSKLLVDRSTTQPEQHMTPFDTLLYTLWLPRLRQSIK